MTKAEIIALAERVERAEGPDRGLDAVIHEAVTTFPARRAGPGWPDENAAVVPAFPGWRLLPAFTASLDAAMTLVPEGWEWTINTFANPKKASAYLVNGTNEMVRNKQQYQANPCLALTSASLRAIAEGMEE